MDGGFLTYKGTIYPWHCDHMGHMNVRWYTGRFDEATWLFVARFGLTPPRLRAARRGLVAVEQHLRYVRELTAGDVFRIESRLIEVGAKSMRFAHEMRLLDEHDAYTLAATCELTGLLIDLDRRKTVPFDEATAARLAEALPTA